MVEFDRDLYREHPDLVAYRVKGSCLEPEINDRDIVYVNVAILDPRPGTACWC